MEPKRTLPARRMQRPPLPVPRIEKPSTAETIHLSDSDESVESPPRSRALSPMSLSPPALSPVAPSQAPSSPTSSEPEKEIPSDEDGTGAGEEERTAVFALPDPRYLDLTVQNYLHRRLIQNLDEAYVELREPSQKAFTERFMTVATSVRYEQLCKRELIDMRCLPLGVRGFDEVEKVIHTAGLIHSVVAVPLYIKEVVLEFLANLPDIEERGGYNLVYIRGEMYEFDSNSINAALNLPRREAPSPQILPVDRNMDDIVHYVTGGKKGKWEEMTVSDLTPTMRLLHQVCCYNWMPLPRPHKYIVEKFRLKLMYLVDTNADFDFGSFIHAQIMGVAWNLNPYVRGIPFPNLIHRVLEYHRIVKRYPEEVLSQVPYGFTLAESFNHVEVGESSRQGQQSQQPTTLERLDTDLDHTPLDEDLKLLTLVLQKIQLKIDRRVYTKQMMERIEEENRKKNED